MCVRGIMYTNIYFCLCVLLCACACVSLYIYIYIYIYIRRWKKTKVLLLYFTYLIIGLIWKYYRSFYSKIYWSRRTFESCGLLHRNVSMLADQQESINNNSVLTQDVVWKINRERWMREWKWESGKSDLATRHNDIYIYIYIYIYKADKDEHVQNLSLLSQ